MEPFISETKPSKTLPDINGCPVLTFSENWEEDTVNFPVAPESRTGRISL